MATAVHNTLSGIQDIDALLWLGTKWNTGNLTFSFPASASVYPGGSATDPNVASFQALIPQLEARVRAALATFSEFANVKFTEITETATTHADIRFGMAGVSGHPLDELASSFSPGSPGDIWLQKGAADFTNPDFVPAAFVSVGSLAFLDLMRSIGQALGLAHPTGLLQPAHDGFGYSIMEDRAFPGEALPATPVFKFPETPMIADVEALQYLYGANFKTNNTDTVYTWDPHTGQEFINGVAQEAPNVFQIYMTVWDGGGVDTYDFSNFSSNVKADLRPGQFSTPAFLPGSSANLLPDQGTDSLGHVVYAPGSIANALLFNGDTRSLIENAIGGHGDDNLIGNQGNNVLTGNDGDDTLFYTGGVDTFFGGAKRTKGDTADFSLSEVPVVITPVATNVTTTLANGHTVIFQVSDTSSLADANGDAYDASYVSEVGLLHIVSMHGIENINGSRFADVITGNLGDNFIFGGDGDDHVFYTGGFDAIDGGNDVDTIDFSQFGAAVDVTLQLLLSAPEVFTTNTSSVFTGTAVPIADLKNFENIVGTAFADSLIGNNFNNNIDGGAGNDFLSYNGGFDVLNGNTGIDTAKFDQMTSAVFVDLAGGGFEAKGNGTANANAGGLSNLADLQSIENLLGTSYNDVLRGDGNANLIDGGAGSDILGGRAGNNTLEGGPGNDSYEFTGSAHDTYFDDSGTDRILIGSISDFIGSGRQGNDLVLTFTNGTIDIEDQFNGHPIETLVDIHGVTLVLATSMTGGDGSGIISGTDGNDVMDGRGGDDYLFGGKGNDHLLGGTGNDHLDGGAGRDLLEGGAGDDILTGGRGRDIFVFTPASQTSPGSGNDVITDFQAGKDQIDLTAFHASFRALDDNHDGQLESGEGDGHISVHVHNGDTTLTFNGGSVRIEGVTHLTAHDLLL